MAHPAPHATLEVRICARGTLPESARRELAGFDEWCDNSHVVLRGEVADLPAIVGVLELLRRAGLHIRDVELVPLGGSPASGTSSAVARIAFLGNVSELLTLVIDGARIAETPATTTVEVALPDDTDALFELLAHVERLALDIVELHVRPERGSRNGRGGPTLEEVREHVSEAPRSPG
ncbi:MAG: hypothetical protein EOL91_01255 [Actinobacteria bacterium]|nr:hypothetical protein [Actinomycetota bacterium]